MKRSRSEHRDEVDQMLKMVNSFHEHDVDVSARTIFVGSYSVDADGGEGGVDAKMAERVLKNMHLLERMPPGGTITLLMNNIGGDEYHGCAIIDAIQKACCTVDVVVRGHAMSMGSLILQAATGRRVMGPYSMQMIHYGTWGFYNHAKTSWKWALEGKRFDELMEEIYLQKIRQKHPGFSLKKLRKLLDHDTFLTAQQSVDLGLADEVG